MALLNTPDRIWVFDLDDTLYPRDIGLWAEISARISAYVKNHLGVDDDEVKRLRAYFRETYGGALQGLAARGSVDRDDFLRFVHDIDYSRLHPDPALHQAVKVLLGKKYIFTNGDKAHAERTLKHLGMTDCFDDIYDITAGNYVPKPFVETYRHFLESFGLEAEKIVMFEDSLVNLESCKALGMTTVYVGAVEQLPDFVDFKTDNLCTFLKALSA